MFFKTRLYFTAIVTFAIWALLAWDHYNGGVPSHHILANKDLPAFSNWWGGLLLPLLTWLLLYRIQKRIISRNNGNPKTTKYAMDTLYRFAGALLFGILLSVFFTLGYSDIPGYMVLGLLPLGLFFPIYRAECLLGFVIGMTFTFGGVLPTGIGSIFALVGFILYRCIRRGISFVVSRFARIVSANKQKPDS